MPSEMKARKKCMNAKETIKALVIDYEKIVRDFLTRFLTLKGIKTIAVGVEFEAIEAAKREKFDIVFLELQMRRIGNPSLLRELKEINPHSKYLMMAAYLKEDLWQEAIKEGADVCFKKPFELDEIISEIDKVRFLRLTAPHHLKSGI